MKEVYSLFIKGGIVEAEFENYTALFFPNEAQTQTVGFGAYDFHF